MAVDTRNKRASAISVGRPWTPTAPNPDGSLANQADRQHVCYSYPGILASAPVVAVAVCGDVYTIPTYLGEIDSVPACLGNVFTISAYLGEFESGC